LALDHAEASGDASRPSTNAILPDEPVEIEARDLSIALDGKCILSGLNFRLPAGLTTAIVGRTGSGKSTLTDALVRLVDVPAQSLFFGGNDITAIPLSILRAQIAYAPQDPFLFSASIADNIAFGRRWSGEGIAPTADNHNTVDRAAIAQAAKDAGLGRDLSELPDGLDTLVGERGITLSGGQRQRVALARALYAQTPLVILDDSLSSVDAETEQTILAQLRSHLGRRTAVIISHRVAAVRHAHEILVLDQGQIVERGQHQELLRAQGTYAALYQEQKREAILEIAK
jgi:ATP-binding cassette subfamily B protein